MLTVQEIWSYPVKSMVGETVNQCTLDEVGILGDRIWAARDLERGGIRGAKKIGGLMRLMARNLDSSTGLVEITLPDGSTVRTDNTSVHQIVSAAIEHPIILEKLRNADDLEHFRRGAPDSENMMDELRAVFGRVDDEPLPDFSNFPPEIMEFESPPGSYYDAWPLMVMTTSALRSLAKAVPDSNMDVRRFRPSVVIDSGDEDGHPEFSWKGKHATIGTARIEFLDACPRCVMVTRDINETIPADKNVLRHIVRDLNQNVGVYARITQPGSFDAGDVMSFV